MKQDEEDSIIKGLGEDEVDTSHARMIGDKSFWDTLQRMYGPPKEGFEFVEVELP